MIPGSRNVDGFGWDLPPGCRQQDIDAQWEGDDEDDDPGEDPREDPHYDY